jgi:hypothetical protein
VTYRKKHDARYRDNARATAKAHQENPPGCSKVGYPSKRLALGSLRVIAGVLEVRSAYHCPHCARWHLTSLNPRLGPDGTPQRIPHLAEAAEYRLPKSERRTNEPKE